MRGSKSGSSGRVLFGEGDTYGEGDANAYDDWMVGWVFDVVGVISWWVLLSLF